MKDIPLWGEMKLIFTFGSNVKPEDNDNKYTFASQIYTMEVKDSNGNLLATGDTVVLIKTLDVKGSSVKLKQGTVIKKIRLTDDEEEVDCKIDGVSIVLKTMYLRKKS